MLGSATSLSSNNIAIYCSYSFEINSIVSPIPTQSAPPSQTTTDTSPTQFFSPHSPVRCLTRLLAPVR